MERASERNIGEALKSNEHIVDEYKCIKSN